MPSVPSMLNDFCDEYAMYWTARRPEHGLLNGYGSVTLTELINAYIWNSVGKSISKSGTCQATLKISTRLREIKIAPFFDQSCQPLF